MSAEGAVCPIHQTPAACCRGQVSHQRVPQCCAHRCAALDVAHVGALRRGRQPCCALSRLLLVLTCTFHFTSETCTGRPDSEVCRTVHPHPARPLPAPTPCRAPASSRGTGARAASGLACCARMPSWCLRTRRCSGSERAAAVCGVVGFGGHLALCSQAGGLLFQGARCFCPSGRLNYF